MKREQIDVAGGAPVKHRLEETALRIIRETGREKPHPVLATRFPGEGGISPWHFNIIYLAARR